MDLPGYTPHCTSLSDDQGHRCTTTKCEVLIMPQQKVLTDFFSSPRLRSESHKISAAQKQNPGELSSSKGRGTSPVALSSSHISRKRKVGCDDPKQFILDAGQKKIGIQYCTKCGMVYDIDSLKDNATHDDFHNRLTETKWFRVKLSQLDLWRRQTRSVSVKGGWMFMTTSSSKCSLKKRIETIVLECINHELGFAPDLADVWNNVKDRQAWALITSMDKPTHLFISAVVIIDFVNSANYLAKNEENVVTDEKAECTIGVDRIWVHPKVRGRGVAAILLDVVRSNCVADRIVPRERIAFSDLTTLGTAFAKKYSPTGRVLVYRLPRNEDV